MDQSHHRKNAEHMLAWLLCYRGISKVSALFCVEGVIVGNQVVKHHLITSSVVHVRKASSNWYMFFLGNTFIRLNVAWPESFNPLSITVYRSSTNVTAVDRMCNCFVATRQSSPLSVMSLGSGSFQNQYQSLVQGAADDNATSWFSQRCWEELLILSWAS